MVRKDKNDTNELTLTCKANLAANFSFIKLINGS